MASSDIRSDSLNVSDSTIQYTPYQLSLILSLLQGGMNRASAPESSSSAQDVLTPGASYPSSETTTPAVEDPPAAPSVTLSPPLHQNNFEQTPAFDPIAYLSTLPPNTNSNVILHGLLVGFNGDVDKLVRFVNSIASLPPQSFGGPQHSQYFVHPVPGHIQSRPIRPLPVRARAAPYAVPQQNMLQRANIMGNYASTISPALYGHPHAPQGLAPGFRFPYGQAIGPGAYQPFGYQYAQAVQNPYYPAPPQLASAVQPQIHHSPENAYITPPISSPESTTSSTMSVPTKRLLDTIEGSPSTSEDRLVRARELIFEPVAVEGVENMTPCQWHDTWASRPCGTLVEPTTAAVSRHLREDHNLGCNGESRSTVKVHCRWGGCRSTRAIQFRSLTRHIGTSHLDVVKYRCPSGEPACDDVTGRRDIIVRHIKTCHMGEDDAYAQETVAREEESPSPPQEGESPPLIDDAFFRLAEENWAEIFFG